MKAILVVIVLVGLGYLAYAKAIAPSPARACDHLADLCSQKLDPAESAQCTQLFDGIQKNNPVDSSARCVIDAKTCAEAIGCVAGGATRVGLTAGGQLLDGFMKGLK